LGHVAQDQSAKNGKDSVYVGTLWPEQRIFVEEEYTCEHFCE
jgi:hypothetical protein